MWRIGNGRRRTSAPRPTVVRNGLRESDSEHVSYPTLPNGILGQMVPVCTEDAILSERQHSAA